MIRASRLIELICWGLFRASLALLALNILYSTGTVQAVRP